MATAIRPVSVSRRGCYEQRIQPQEQIGNLPYFPLDINQLVSAFKRNLTDRSTLAAAETSTGAMILNNIVEFVV